MCAATISLSLFSSYMYFDVVEDSFERYYFEKHEIEATVISTRYVDSNISGYDIVVKRIDGEKRQDVESI